MLLLNKKNSGDLIFVDEYSVCLIEPNVEGGADVYITDAKSVRHVQQEAIDIAHMVEAAVQARADL